MPLAVLWVGWRDPLLHSAKRGLRLSLCSCPTLIYRMLAVNPYPPQPGFAFTRPTDICLRSGARLLCLHAFYT